MKRDVTNWAKPVAKLQAADVAGAINANVQGKRVSGALQGFGRMYQKTFRVRLAGATVTPREVVQTWKERYPEFWPKGNRFYASSGGIAPGEVGLINASVPGAPTMATGVLVLYADEESFTFMTPQGHPFAGWITFSAYDDAGTTVAQVQEFIRASDPLWELGMATFIGRKQNRIWIDTLTNVAAHFGATADVEKEVVVVDRRRQWAHAKNVWHNAGVRSGLYAISAPLRMIRRRVR